MEACLALRISCFPLEDQRHEEEYEGAGDEADGQVRERRVDGMVVSEVLEQAIQGFDHRMLLPDGRAFFPGRQHNSLDRPKALREKGDPGTLPVLGWGSMRRLRDFLSLVKIGVVGSVSNALTALAGFALAAAG